MSDRYSTLRLYLSPMISITKMKQRESTRTMQALEFGKITKAVHTEIVSSLAHSMMQYTKTPSSQVTNNQVAR